MYKNARFHNEIKKWNTGQLIEVLETNGLGDCCDAIQAKDIDGEAFLKLNEGQLALWKNILSNVQIKRLWSYIQLAKEKPQDFVINLPNTEHLNNRKTEKIKSPISESLKNILEQQNNPTLVIPQPDGNYPKVVPLYPNNDIQQNFPPKPSSLPKKPLSAGRRPVPPPQVNDIPQENNIRPPIPINNYQRSPNNPPNTFYPKPSNIPEITSYPKPQNIPQIPPNVSFPKPPNLLPSNIPYRKPPNISQAQETYEEEQIYEDEPLIEHDFSRTLPPPPPTNTSNLYKLSNPVPIRREVPPPSILGRPLPTPPQDESPLSVPHLVPPRNKSPQPPDNLPRPPFIPQINLPLFENSNDDDEEQVEYDIVDEAQIPEYKQQSWFKDVDRKNAALFLQGHPNGTFIARPSKQQEHECTFTLIYEGKIYNVPIFKDNGKVTIGKNSFNTVSEIVERFIENPLVLNGPNNEDVLVTLRRL